MHFITSFPSFILTIASGIILFIYSWKLALFILVGTIIIYPIVGKRIVSIPISIIYYLLTKLADKKEKEDVPQ